MKKTVIKYRITNADQPTIPSDNRIVIFDNPKGLRIALHEALERDLLEQETWTSSAAMAYSPSSPAILSLILEALAFGKRDVTEQGGVRTVDLGTLGAFNAAGVFKPIE